MLLETMSTSSDSTFTTLASSTLMTGLENYWSFNEPSGVWLDSVGGNNLTAAGTVIYSSAGRISRCYDTNSGLGVAYGNGVDLSARSFTISGWTQMYGAGTSSINGLLGQGDAGTSTCDFSLLYRIDLTKWAFSSGPTGTNVIELPGTYDETGTVWYFVCVRYDSASSTLRLRVNTTNAANVTGSTGIPSHASGSAALLFGQFNFSAVNYHAFARMDEWGIWGRSLSDAEVTELYNGGAGLPYPF